MLDVNLTGAFLSVTAALGDLTRGDAQGRAIVFIASTAGLKGYAYVAAYCAAKHGVVGLARALAAELAPRGVTVNAVCPGFTDTPLLGHRGRLVCSPNLGRRGVQKWRLGEARAHGIDSHPAARTRPPTRAQGQRRRAWPRNRRRHRR